MSKSSLLSIVMLGDVMLGRLVDEALTHMHDAGESLWGDTLPLLQGGMAQPDGHQIVTGNLECAVTVAETAVPKAFNFKLSPSNISALHTARFRFVSMANNHSLDYGFEGLVESMHTLKEAGIAFAGVGVEEEAAAPAVVEESGVKVAFLSYSDHYDHWKATETRLGINFIDPDSCDGDKVVQQVQRAVRAGDIPIVFIHWGPNWSWHPSEGIKDLAHKFIDAGAAAVFGHSSHHVQPIEVYNTRPIIYGAGGFIDDYALHPDYRNDLGFLYALHTEDTRPLSLELVPTKITHEWQRDPTSRPPYLSSVHKATGQDRAWLCRTVRRLSEPYGTAFVDTPRGLLLALPK